MKRFHVHVAVEDLAASTRFYADLFGAPPTVAKADYAKWSLEDPRVNFAISRHGARAGVDHLGIEVEGADELGAVHARLEAAGRDLREKGETTCCYARSEKGWVTDPTGIAWETFWTRGAATTYGGGRGLSTEAPCCGPEADAGRAAEAAASPTAAPCCGPTGPSVAAAAAR